MSRAHYKRGGAGVVLLIAVECITSKSIHNLKSFQFCFILPFVVFSVISMLPSVRTHLFSTLPPSPRIFYQSLFFGFSSSTGLSVVTSLSQFSAISFSSSEHSASWNKSNTFSAIISTKS